MPKTLDPLAAVLDAAVDAQHAGVADDEVQILAAMGEQIADLAAELKANFDRLSDGAMETVWNGRLETRRRAQMDVAELAAVISEAAFGGLDQFAVIRAAIELRLAGEMSAFQEAA